MIVSAVQEGAYVYVYGENNVLLCTISCPGGSSGVLVTFTSRNVTIRSGLYLYIYDENGNLVQKISLA